MEQEVDRLAAHEALALAGLARMLIRMDGRFTEAERDTLSQVATTIAVVEDPAGAAPASPIGEEALYALLDRAGAELANDAAVRAAALRVTRQEARATIHALLFEIAASDVISTGESTLLDWLAEKWELETPRDLPGEETDAG